MPDEEERLSELRKEITAKGAVLDQLSQKSSKAFCPFCLGRTKNPHLYLNTEKNRFFCQRCGEHGNSVSLYAKIRGISNKESCESVLNSVYTRSGQNSTPNSNATNLHSSQKRCCSFCISSSNASPTFQVQKSIFHQMTKPIQVTVILPLLLAISFSRNDDIHSSISGISNDLIGVIPTIGQ